MYTLHFNGFGFFEVMRIFPVTSPKTLAFAVYPLLQRDAMLRAVINYNISVCPPVSPSHAGIVPKRMNVGYWRVSL